MTENDKRHKVLVVDDVPGNIKVLAKALSQDYRVLVATNGEDALKTAQTENIDTILLDVEMPGMNGFEVCERLHATKITRRIPVIFTTSRKNSEDIARGLSLGAFYYLTKPLDISILLAIVQAAINRRTAHQCLYGQIQVTRCPLSLHMEEARFRIQTMSEAFQLSVLLSLTCPNPEKAAIGLREILINAVEHGNLGITYEEKGILNSNNKLEEEIKRRLALPENQEKHVVVLFTRKEDEISFHIRDDGSGFDSEPYLDFNPERMLDTHGRGIAIAVKASFDDVRYLGSGNEVECTIKL
ncbi:MAG: response regulator [Magnetococcales bacterium]|nr:response regulator [Magnetococcales bacterium]MBF0419324.1 response regulator [Magnetococcales bacterium]